MQALQNEWISSLVTLLEVDASGVNANGPERDRSAEWIALLSAMQGNELFGKLGRKDGDITTTLALFGGEELHFEMFDSGSRQVGVQQSSYLGFGTMKGDSTDKDVHGGGGGGIGGRLKSVRVRMSMRRGGKGGQGSRVDRVG